MCGCADVLSAHPRRRATEAPWTVSSGRSSRAYRASAVDLPSISIAGPGLALKLCGLPRHPALSGFR
eukprot:7762341-Alexandrium_andersonii.AAC.1